MADHKNNPAWNNRAIRFSRVLLVVFYGVGVAGMALSFTRPLFTALIPFALLLSMGILLFFQPRLKEGTTLGIFLVIYLAGFLVEMMGTNTGEIFGKYLYGSGLGPKIFNTPLMIGINWLMLSLAFTDLVARSGIKGWAGVPVAAAGMVVYDLVLEQVAPRLDMWNWEGGTIPLRNYAAWFTLALLFQILLRVTRIPVKNPVAPAVLLCQFFFFLLLLLFLIIRGL